MFDYFIASQIYYVFLAPESVTNLSATRYNTTTAQVSWTNPVGVWESVTITCDPYCPPISVDYSAAVNNTTEVTGLTPGTTYNFSAVVSSNDVNSSTVQTGTPLTLGMISTDQLACEQVARC